MTSAWLLTWTVKSALLLAAAGFATALLHRRSAATRHLVWTLGVLAVLAVPLLAAVMPAGFVVDAPLLDATPTLHADALVVTGGGAAPAAVPWLLGVWAAGALVVLARVVRAQRAARRLVQGSEPARDERWIAAQSEAEAVLGISGVSVRRSEAIASPMTIGALHPRVLLPAAADGWPADRLRAVLVHELGHVRRRDLLVQLVAAVACALQWWNPLAWFAAHRLRHEREYACDDLVIAAGTRASSYATDLLDVSRSVSRAWPGHAGACMADTSGIERRLRRLLDAHVPRGSVGGAFRVVAGGVALASAALVACTTASASMPPDEVRAVEIGAPSIEYGVRGPFEQPAFERRATMQPEDARYLALVTAEVERNAPALERCYERRLRAKPALAGEILIHWTIAMDGSVPDQCITRDSVADPALADCVNELVSTSRFPAPRGAPVSVLFPFVFRGK